MRGSVTTFLMGTASIVPLAMVWGAPPDALASTLKVRSVATATKKYVGPTVTMRMGSC